MHDIQSFIQDLCKNLWLLAGGVVGWVVAEFSPTFPLITIAAIFIFSDAYTAYLLDRRVHARYPDRKAREKAKFTSFAFGKTIKRTLPMRIYIILLAYLAEHWVFVHISVPLSYIVTGAILFEQAWSMLENQSSCRDEKESKFWKVLQAIMVDKTERHFDIDLDKLKKEEEEAPKEENNEQQKRTDE